MKGHPCALLVSVVQRLPENAMSSDRTANLLRQTKETKIELAINLDGRGDATVSTGVGFFDHMLDLLSRHSLIDLDVTADGDLQVDSHHTVEDVGIVLGQAIEKAIGDKRGIQRYGWAIVPMDESLAQVAVDLSGRPAFVFNVTFTGPTIGDKKGIYRYGWAIVPMDESLAQVAIDLSGRPAFVFNVQFKGPSIGEFPVELVDEFFKSVATTAKMNLHITVPYGTNNHHIAEAIFKATAKALRQAVSIDPRAKDAVPSTKGSLNG